MDTNKHSIPGTTSDRRLWGIDHREYNERAVISKNGNTTVNVQLSVKSLAKIRPRERFTVTTLTQYCAPTKESDALSNTIIIVNQCEETS